MLPRAGRPGWRPGARRSRFVHVRGRGPDAARWRGNRARRARLAVRRLGWMTGHLDAAARLLGRYPLIDGHNDLAWELREAGAADLDRTDVAAAVGFTHTDLPRLARGGVGAQFWSVFVPASLTGEATVTTT